jgi:DNA-binding CsgD family transcriptional regulator
MGETSDDLVTRFQVLEHMPGLFAVKDLNSRYCSMSSGILRVTGWTSLSDAIYKTDYDMPGPASEGAEQFIKGDNLAIKARKSVIIINVFRSNEGISSMLSERHPLIGSQDIIIGVMSHAMDITEFFLNQHKWLTRIDTKFTGEIKTPQQYVLTPESSPLPLSTRQQECLSLVIRGKTIREIAFILRISTRTVETHIDTIKEKLGCTSKSQLIEKAINSGFLFHIPHSLLG